ncbi:hypothetical protein GY45DRAFT_174789 [Cubamyces sp. BRFM 1775]|nr:hypothetical protein GY45DRAFT_174789 [Cubamyces sp. BRFM 1775]
MHPLSLRARVTIPFNGCFAIPLYGCVAIPLLIRPCPDMMSGNRLDEPRLGFCSRVISWHERSLPPPFLSLYIPDLCTSQWLFPCSSASNVFCSRYWSSCTIATAPRRCRTLQGACR